MQSVLHPVAPRPALLLKESQVLCRVRLRRRKDVPTLVHCDVWCRKTRRKLPAGRLVDLPVHARASEHMQGRYAQGARCYQGCCHLA